MHDAELALAFALERNPGSYAVLVGAGMSRSAGLPTAWDVQLDLISRIRTMRTPTGEADPDLDEAAWFQREFEAPPEYDRLLGLVGDTSTERQAVLRDYFAPESATPRATPAHTALARMVAAGTVRVVITLNFDHLIEDAIRAEGVDPTIISTPDQFAAAVPLHAQRALVVHLHGDYTDAPSLLNTTEELQEYDPRTQHLIDQIAREYGLIILGWSADWDVALRRTLSGQQNPHFSTWWYDPAPLTNHGRVLAHDRPAVYLADTADAALPRLLDAVTSTRAQHRQLPTRPQVAAAGIRRRLVLDPRAGEVEDELAGLFDQMQQHPILLARDFSFTPGEAARRLERFEQDSAVLRAATAAVVRAGADSTETWWFDGLDGLTFDRLSGGSTELIELQNYPATLIWYAAGIAAVASRRFDRVRRMFRDLTLLNREGHRRPAPEVIGSDKTFPYNNPSRHLFDVLQPTFIDALGMTGFAWEQAWELFEYLTLLDRTHRGLSRQDRNAIAPLARDAWIAQPEGTGFRASALVPEEKELRAFLKNYFADGLGSGPHLRTLGMSADYSPRVSSQIRYQLTHTETHLLLEAALFPSPDDLRAAVAVLDDSLARLARDAAYRPSEAAGGGLIRNTGFWIDDPATN